MFYLWRQRAKCRVAHLHTLPPANIAYLVCDSNGDCDSGGGDDEDNGGHSAGGGHKQQSTK